MSDYGTELTVPHTGEVLELASMRLASIAELVLDIRDLESRLREAKRILGEEVCRRADRERQFTLRDGPFKVSVPSDALVSVWDGAELAELLDTMVIEGEIELGARERAVTEEISYKIHTAGINALLKSPELAPRIEACRQQVPPHDRRLTVSRAT